MNEYLDTLYLLEKHRKIHFPKELELSTENEITERSPFTNRIAFQRRDSGETVNMDIANIPDAGDVIQTGTWDVAKRTIEDVLDETIVFCDLMAMTPGEYNNPWFLALCADPDANESSFADGSAFFSIPIGGRVLVEKFANLGGFAFSEDNMRRIENRASKLPVKGKIVRVRGKKQDYFDLASANS